MHIHCRLEHDRQTIWSHFAHLVEVCNRNKMTYDEIWWNKCAVISPRDTASTFTAFRPTMEDVICQGGHSVWIHGAGGLTNPACHNPAAKKLWATVSANKSNKSNKSNKTWQDYELCNVWECFGCVKADALPGLPTRKHQTSWCCPGTELAAPFSRQATHEHHWWWAASPEPKQQTDPPRGIAQLLSIAFWFWTQTSRWEQNQPSLRVGLTAFVKTSASNTSWVLACLILCG